MRHRPTDLSRLSFVTLQFLMMDDSNKVVLPEASEAEETNSESNNFKKERASPSANENGSVDQEINKKAKPNTDENEDTDDAKQDSSLTSKEQEQAIETQDSSIRINVEELGFMLGLVSDIEHFRKMTRPETIRFLHDAKVGKLSFQLPDATEIIQHLICNHNDDVEGTPCTEQVHTGQVTYLDMICELRSYYSTHPDRGYLLAELRPKEMGQSFVWEDELRFLPDAIRGGIEERMVMKIDDVEAYMGEEGSDTEVRVVATMTFEALAGLFSFIPNINEGVLGSKRGSISLCGQMGSSNCTFLQIGRTSNAILSAEVKDIQIPVGGQDLILTDPLFSLQFSSFTELSEDGTKYVNRRIMASSIAAKAKWFVDAGGDAATLNFHCSLGDSRQDFSSAHFHADAEELKLPFGDIFFKDFSIGVQSFSPLTLEVSTSLRFGESYSNEIRLDGTWSKTNGFDLSSNPSEDEIYDFTRADLIGLYSKVTHSSESLSKLPDSMFQNECTLLKKAIFRYNTTPQLLEVSNEEATAKAKGGDATGLTMEADLVRSETDTSSRVLLSISKEGGIAIIDTRLS